VLILGASLAAWLNANFLGSLAWASPGQPYTERFKIEHTQLSGSKYRSVNLDLVSLKDQKRYSLVLSKRLFNYPKFISPDQIVLYGKETVFGVYIERFEQPTASPLR
jgi:hypothetical protein